MNTIKQDWRVRGKYNSREELEDAIAKTLYQEPDISWRELGLRHGITKSTARYITVNLIIDGKVPMK